MPAFEEEEGVFIKARFDTKSKKHKAELEAFNTELDKMKVEFKIGKFLIVSKKEKTDLVLRVFPAEMSPIDKKTGKAVTPKPSQRQLRDRFSSTFEP